MPVVGDALPPEIVESCLLESARQWTALSGTGDRPAAEIVENVEDGSPGLQLLNEELLASHYRNSRDICCHWNRDGVREMLLRGNIRPMTSNQISGDTANK